MWLKIYSCWMALAYSSPSCHPHDRVLNKLELGLVFWWTLSQHPDDQFSSDPCILTILIPVLTYAVGT